MAAVSLHGSSRGETPPHEGLASSLGFSRAAFACITTPVPSFYSQTGIGGTSAAGTGFAARFVNPRVQLSACQPPVIAAVVHVAGHRQLRASAGWRRHQVA